MTEELNADDMIIEVDLEDTEDIEEEYEEPPEPLPSVPLLLNPKQDDYAPLKEDFAHVIESALRGFQEKTAGREIKSVVMRVHGRYGIIVQTNDEGLIEMPLLTTIEIDNQGNAKMQRAFLGMNCSIATKGTTFRAANLLRRGETAVKEFEVNAAAYELVKRATSLAQTSGEDVQRKIEEENEEFWEAALLPESGVTSINLDVDGIPSASEIFELVSLARATMKQELGAKLADCKIVFFSIIDTQEISTSTGTKADLCTPRTGIIIEAKTNKGHTAFKAIRGVGGMEVLNRYCADLSTPRKDVVLNMAKEVAKLCVDLDRAQPSSVLGGEAYVLLDSSVTGILAHEVYGHPSESDIIVENRRNKDAELNLKSRIGGQVSENSAFSIVDDGGVNVQLGDVVLHNCFGSIVMDDEGTSPKATFLVDHGIQRLVLNSAETMNEILDGLQPNIFENMEKHGLTGNLRSERFDKIPMVRMTNTFILPNPNGLNSLQEMAALVPNRERGVYVRTVSGGWVDPNSGEFQLTGELGYLIENGVITDKPVKDIIIRGNITKFGNNIEAVGSSKTIAETSSGWCGKDRQWVPVDDGGPAILLADAAVGEQPRGWSWKEAYREYARQLEEVAVGKRKPEEKYFKFVDDSTEHLVTNHKDLCMVVCSPSPEDELSLLFGLGPSTASYTIGEGGVLDE